MNKPGKRCEEIVKFIIKSEAVVFKELNTKTLAKMYGVNRSYLSRTFKKFTRSAPTVRSAKKITWILFL
jgi:AraC-like DNA-binding protein